MADSHMSRRTYWIPSSDLAFLKFILEGYDGLGIITTLDPGPALVQVSVAPGREPEWAELIEILKQDIPIRPAPAQPHGPDVGIPSNPLRPGKPD